MSEKQKNGYIFLTGVLGELMQEVNNFLDAAAVAEAVGDQEKALCLLNLASKKEVLILRGVGYAINNLSTAG